MKKKKILFINGHLNPGGCEKSLVDVLKHIDFNRYEVDLLLLEELGSYYKELPSEVQVYLYSLNDSFGPFISCLNRSIKSGNHFSFQFRLVYMFSHRLTPKLWKAGKKLFGKLQTSYDTIIAYRPGICTELAAYMFSASRKISWWHHGNMLYNEKGRQDLDKAYTYMTDIIAVSKSSAELLSEYFPKHQEKIHIIDNMIDQNELFKKSILPIDDMNTDADNILISVGRFSSEKNMLMCVDIAKSILFVCPKLNFCWYLIGDGQEFEKVQNEIIQNHLSQYIILLGRRDNPYPYMLKAKLLIHPSLVESQGLTILESMSLGIPVIAVASLGPKEYINNGINGVLCEPDVEIIADQILTYLSDKDKYETLRKNTECPEKFSSINVMDKINNILERDTK